MNRLTDSHTREREALAEASRQILICCARVAATRSKDDRDWQGDLDPAHAALRAYGRAVREADKEAIHDLRLNAQKRTMMVDACWAGKLDCREVLALALQDAAAAIEALEEKP